jgi:23S rRNA (guanosine2251-2'-O)-methyltransferase
MSPVPPPDSEFLYGLNPVFETVLASRRDLRRAFLNEQSADRGRIRTLADLLRERNVPVEWVDKGRLSQLAGTREHQGAVIETGPFPYTPFADLVGAQRMVLVDNLEDPHNVGAVMRSAEVFGFDAVLLPRRGCPGVLPSVVKASAGGSEHLRVAVNCSSNQYVKIALEEGYAVIALDGKGQVALEDAARTCPEKLLLVVGGESKGVRQFIINAATAVVRIPQSGRINSLNASVAAGIAIHAFGAALEQDRETDTPS